MLSLREFGLLLPGLVGGLTVHEFCHVLMAKLLGDRSAAAAGRLTLNPLKHLSPLGVLALFLVGFGWAKPVPINVYNFKKPRLYLLLASLAGPIANVVVASLIILAINVIPMSVAAFTVLILSAYINVVLAVINFLPVPPLDGSRIWTVLVPNLRLVNRGWSNIVFVVLLVIALRAGLLDRLFRLLFAVVDSFVFV